MIVNPKKPICFLNNTKYFSPEKDKVRITVASPRSYQSKCTKTEGYEARLYYHYKYCESVNGQVFYYTLTYNQRAMPKYFGINCFDYEDLRDLLTGGFRKQLLRKYGTIFKYFVGAELGDGKGSRGMHNNPHYHLLFFLEPDPAGKFPYQKIPPKDFRHLVKMYWQGFDENLTGFQDYRTAKYGIAKEGDNDGVVTDFRACVYCAKYVVKDVALKCHEDKVRSCLKVKFESGLRTEVFYKDFYHTVIFDKFNVPLNPSKSAWSMSDSDLYLFHFPEPLAWSDDLFGSPDVLCTFYKCAVEDFVKKYSLERELRDFYEQRLNELIEYGLNEYRNRYCNKCRISHGVGDSPINELKKMAEPMLEVPTKDGFKLRPLSLYYYRKLFTQLIRPIEPGCKVGTRPVALSPTRILTEDGINYRLTRLSSNIRKKADEARANLALVLNNPDLYHDMQLSDVNTDVFLTHEQVKTLTQYIYESRKSPFLDYAVYKLVYEGRYFSAEGVDLSSESFSHCPDYIADYKRFIIPSIYSVDRSDIRLDAFLKDDNSSYLPFSEFPFFRPLIGFAALLDLCADYFAVQSDNKAETEAKRRQAVKRFHDSRQLKVFYAKFK